MAVIGSDFVPNLLQGMLWRQACPAPASLWSLFVAATRTVQSIVIIVDRPLRVVRQCRIASFESLKFTYLIGAVRYPDQVGIFHCLGAILLDGEH